MHMYVVAYGGQGSTSGVIFQELSTLVFETESPTGTQNSPVRLN